MFNVNVHLLLVADHPQDGDIYLLVNDANNPPFVIVKENNDIDQLAKDLYVQVTQYSPVWGGLKFKKFVQEKDTINFYYQGRLSLFDKMEGYSWQPVRQLTNAAFPLEGLR